MNNTTGDERDSSEEPKTDPRFYLFRDAVKEDKQKAAQLLSEDASLLELRSSIGETALHFLAVEDEIESVAWLVERGANIDPINEFGDTPLMDAAALDYTELCRYLIDHGANMRFINEEDETSVFSKAATASTPAITTLKALLEYLPIEEDIDDYFGEWDTMRVWQAEGEVAELLAQRGLRKRSE